MNSSGCIVCRSDRAAIDAMLLNRVPLRQIANTYGFSVTALWTHSKKHLASASTSITREALSKTGAQEVIADAKGIKKRARELWRLGKRTNKPEVMSSALGRMTAALEVQLRASTAVRITETHKQEGYSLDELAEELAEVPGAIEALKRLEERHGRKEIEGENGAGAAQEAGSEIPAFGDDRDTGPGVGLSDQDERADG